MSKVKYLTLLCVLLTGCATDWNKLARYDFSITTPQQSRELKYSDKNIDIEFSIPISNENDCNGLDCTRFIAYSGISFNLKNKSSEVVIIDWNKISFKDYNGLSGNAVMHTGIKYNECASPKTPSTIPPNGAMVDVITPCYAVSFAHAGPTIAWWKVSMLRKAEEQRPLDFGVFMPIQFGDLTTNYDFSFHATIANVAQ